MLRKLAFSIKQVFPGHKNALLELQRLLDDMLGYHAQIKSVTTTTSSKTVDFMAGLDLSIIATKPDGVVSTFHIASTRMVDNVIVTSVSDSVFRTRLKQSLNQKYVRWARAHYPFNHVS